MSGVPFDDLVTTATVGVTRKGLTVGELAGPAAGYAGTLDAADPAAALFDAAALQTVARRAGVRPARDVTVPPGPGPADAGVDRELSARATLIVHRVGQSDTGPVFAAGDTGLLADLLTAAGAAGYTAPAPLLPALLDAALRHEVLFPAVTAVLGARGRWLAARRPLWRQAFGAPDPGQRAGHDGRLRSLTELRRTDPAAALDLVRAQWAASAGADRAALLSALDPGLSAADEEFLEAALDDRADDVRRAARLLLGRLPDSAFRHRAARRGQAALRVERRGLRRLLVPVLPGEPDAEAVRDGITGASPATAIGPGAWRLIQVLAAAPLDQWSERLQLTPAEIVALRAEGDLAVHLRAGWRLAVVRQRAGRQLTDWARALLGADAGSVANWPPSVWPASQSLAALLPDGERARWSVAQLDRVVVGRPAWTWARPVLSDLADLPAPWPPAVAEAMIRLLGLAAGRSETPQSARDQLSLLLALAGRALPADGRCDYAAQLTAIAAAHPDDWAHPLRDVAETITLRRAFLAELRQPTP